MPINLKDLRNNLTLPSSPTLNEADKFERHLDIQSQLRGIRNQEEMYSLTRSLLKGIYQTGGMAAGAIGMAGSALGFEGPKEWGYETYKRLDRKAREYPTLEMSDIPEGWKTPLRAGQYATEQFFINLPYLLVSLFSYGAGSSLSPLATLGGGKILGSRLAEKVFARAVLGKTGIVLSTAALEGGGNWAEVMDRHKDNPLSAISTGMLAGAIEIAGGNMRWFEKVLGKREAGRLSRTLDRMWNKLGRDRLPDVRDLSQLRQAVILALKAPPEESVQEALQEILSITNVALNDPTFETWTTESANRILESAAGGAAASVISAPAGYASGRLTGRILPADAVREMLQGKDKSYLLATAKKNLEDAQNFPDSDGSFQVAFLAMNELANQLIGKGRSPKQRQVANLRRSLLTYAQTPQSPQDRLRNYNQIYSALQNYIQSYRKRKPGPPPPPAAPPGPPTPPGTPPGTPPVTPPGTPPSAPPGTPGSAAVTPVTPPGTPPVVSPGTPPVAPPGTPGSTAVTPVAPPGTPPSAPPGTPGSAAVEPTAPSDIEKNILPIDLSYLLMKYFLWRSGKWINQVKEPTLGAGVKNYRAYSHSFILQKFIEGLDQGMTPEQIYYHALGSLRELNRARNQLAEEDPEVEKVHEDEGIGSLANFYRDLIQAISDPHALEKIKNLVSKVYPSTRMKRPPATQGEVEAGAPPEEVASSVPPAAPPEIQPEAPGVPSGEVVPEKGGEGEETKNEEPSHVPEGEEKVESQEPYKKTGKVWYGRTSKTYETLEEAEAAKRELQSKGMEGNIEKIAKAIKKRGRKVLAEKVTYKVRQPFKTLQAAQKKKSTLEKMGNFSEVEKVPGGYILVGRKPTEREWEIASKQAQERLKKAREKRIERRDRLVPPGDLTPNQWLRRQVNRYRPLFVGSDVDKPGEVASILPVWGTRTTLAWKKRHRSQLPKRIDTAGIAENLGLPPFYVTANPKYHHMPIGSYVTLEDLLNRFKDDFPSFAMRFREEDEYGGKVEFMEILTNPAFEKIKLRRIVGAEDEAELAEREEVERLEQQKRDEDIERAVQAIVERYGVNKDVLEEMDSLIESYLKGEFQDASDEQAAADLEWAIKQAKKEGILEEDDVIEIAGEIAEIAEAIGIENLSKIDLEEAVRWSWENNPEHFWTDKEIDDWYDLVFVWAMGEKGLEDEPPAIQSRIPPEDMESELDEYIDEMIRGELPSQRLLEEAAPEEEEAAPTEEEAAPTEEEAAPTEEEETAPTEEEEEAAPTEEEETKPEVRPVSSEEARSYMESWYAGEMVWYDEKTRFGLFRGFSRNHNTVYNGFRVSDDGAKTTVTSVDISEMSPQGDFSKEVIERLVEIKNRLVAEEKELQERYPDGPFSDSNVAATSKIPKQFVPIVQEWLKMFKLKARIFLVMRGDITNKTYHEYRLYGDYSNARGYMDKKGIIGRFGPAETETPSYYIVIKPKDSMESMYETLGHEFGHLLFFEVYNNEAPEVRRAIADAFNEYKKNHDLPGVTVREALEARSPLSMLRDFSDADLALQVQEDSVNRGWIFSFEEWLADNVSRWLSREETPRTVIEKFFKKLAGLIKKLYRRIYGAQYRAHTTVEEWLNRLSAGYRDQLEAERTAAQNQALRKGKIREKKNPKGTKIPTPGGLGRSEPNAPSGGPTPDGGAGTEGTRIRRSFRVSKKELLPRPSRTHVTSDTYPNRALNESQLEAVNLALDRFEKGGQGFMLADSCVAGETKIYNPLTGEHVPIAQLAEIGEPTTVLSLTKDGFLPCRTGVPFKKGVMDLYRVTLENGKSVTVTESHLFLTPDGWRRICDGLSESHFLASVEALPENDPEHVPSIHGEDAPNGLRKAEDCLDDYYTDSYRDGERFLPAANNGPESIPLPAGVPSLFYSRWNRIRTIEFVRRDAYYDLCVPDTGNYVAEGIIHHNTGFGKTREMLAVAHQYAQKTGKKVLIVTLNKQIISGSWEKDAKIMGVDLNRFEIGTYDDLRTGKIGGQEYGLVVYDEANAFKNPDSQRSIASLQVKYDHVLFATATPMDTPIGASYFMAQLFGKPVEEVMQKLGFRISFTENPYTKKKQLSAVAIPGFQWATIMDNLYAMRDQAIREGAYIRREYPFYGEIREEEFEAPPDMAQEEEQIYDYWSKKIQNAITPKAKANYSGQRTMEMSRWLESKKIGQLHKMVQRELREGRAVVVCCDGVNDTVIKGLGSRVVRGAISALGDLLSADRIPFARIYGTGNKSPEIERFNNREVNVALMTPQSGSVGINLDDTVGDRPVTLIVATVNFSGNVYDQTIGRVSRYTTQSPARVIYLNARDSFSDQRRDQIIRKKLEILRAIQATEDVDLDMVYGIDDTELKLAESEPSSEVGIPPDVEVEPTKRKGHLTIRPFMSGYLVEGDTYHFLDDFRSIPIKGFFRREKGSKGWYFPKEAYTLLKDKFGDNLQDIGRIKTTIKKLRGKKMRGILSRGRTPRSGTGRLYDLDSSSDLSIPVRMVDVSEYYDPTNFEHNVQAWDAIAKLIVEKKIPGAETPAEFTDFMQLTDYAHSRDPQKYKSPLDYIVNAEFSRALMKMRFKGFVARESGHTIIHNFDESGPKNLGYRGMPKKQVEDYLRPLIRQMRINVTVVQSWHDLPQRVFQELIPTLRAGEIVTGCYDDQDPSGFPQAYVIADTLESREEAVQVLLHETVGHYGISAGLSILGMDYRAFCEWMYKSPRYNYEITVYQMERGISDPVLAADEWFANKIGMHDLHPTLLSKLLHMIQDWLRRIGIPVPFTKSDLQEMIRYAYEATFWPDTFSPSTQEYWRQHGYPSIRASIQSMESITKTEQFTKWFGKSRVVDYEGKPQIALRMTHGSSGTARYLTPLEHPATPVAKARRRLMTALLKQGSRTYPAYIRVEDPMDVSEAEAFSPRGLMRFMEMRGLINRNEQQKIQEMIEKDPPGGISHAEEWDQIILRELHKVLIDRGYDGLRFQVELGDGIKANAWIPFHRDQIQTIFQAAARNPDNKALRNASEKMREALAIDEHEVRSNRLGEAGLRQWRNDPKFLRWFNRGGKYPSVTVDEKGDPLVLYHFSHSQDIFTSFMADSHFGSWQAALDRYDHWELSAASGPRTYPVYVRMSNPFRCNDQQANDPGSLALHMYREGVITIEEYDELKKEIWEAIKQNQNYLGFPRPLFYGKLVAYKMLQKKGYDGLVYRNQVEDRGGDSYVIFHPSDVKSIFNPGKWGENPLILASRREHAKIGSQKESRITQLSRVVSTLANIRSNGNFKRWFRHSQVTGAKGTPQIVFHGTRSPEAFTEFRTPSHFGTYRAANARIQYFIDVRRPGETEDFFRVYPVFLRIENPLLVSDPIANDPFLLLDFAYKRGIFTLQEREDLLDELLTYGNTPDTEHLSYWQVDDWRMTRLADILWSRGYDGLKYMNTFEDPGTYSWVAFRSEQIKSIWNSGEFGVNTKNILSSVKAWHGTWKQIQKFESRFIGSGEGGQAYGYGLYFTSLEDIARFYANSVAYQNDSRAIDRDPIYWWMFDGKAATPLQSRALSYFLSSYLLANLGIQDLGETKSINSKLRRDLIGEIDDVLQKARDGEYFFSEEMTQQLAGPGKTIPEILVELRSLIHDSTELEVVNVNYQNIPRRFVYEVELRNGRTLGDLVWMDWHDTVPQAIKKQIIEAVEKNDELMALPDEIDPDAFPYLKYKPELSAQIQQAINGGEIYHIINRAFNRANDPYPARSSSMLLMDAGVDGIRYRANSLSGNMLRDYNYVVFDEDNVEIKGVYRFSTKSKGRKPNAPPPVSAGSNYWQSALAFARQFWKGRNKNWRDSLEDTTVFDRVLSLPSHYFQKVPGLSRIFDTAIQFLSNRHHFQNILFNDPSDPTKSHLTELWKFQKEQPGEYKKLNNYLFENDRDQKGYRVKKKGKIYTIFNAQGKAIGKDTNRRNAWHKAFEAEAQEYINQGGSPQAGRALYLARMINLRSYFMLESAFLPIIQYCKKNKQPYPTVSFWVYKKNKQGQKVKTKISVSLVVALKRIYSRTGYYMPRIRESGKYAIYAVKPGANPIYRMFNSKEKLNWHATHLRRQGYKIRKSIVSQLPASLFQGLEGPMKIEAIINKALEKIPKNLRIPLQNSGVDIQMLFAQTLVEEVANILRSHTSSAFRIHRGPAKGKNVVIGYREDILFSVVTAGRAIANGTAKRIMAREMMNAITGRIVSWKGYKKRYPQAKYKDYATFVKDNRIDPGKQPNAYRDALTYMADMLRNDEMGDRVIGFLQGLAMLKYLGFRVAAPIINLTVLPTNVVACLKGYTQISASRAMLLIARGIKDYATWWRNPAMLDKGTLRAMIFIHDQGWHEAQFNRESMRVLSATLPQKYDSFVDKAMWMFKTSEKINRVASIMAAARAMLGNKKFENLSDLEFKILMYKAQRISDRANGVYGKANYPMLLRGQGYFSKAGRAFYMFKTFAHNFLLTALELGFSRREWAAMMYMLFAPGLVAGVGAALPLALLLQLIRQFTDDDPEEAFMEFIQDHMGDEAEMFARYGLAGLLNINLKGSLSIDLTSVPTNVNEVMGAPYSVWEDISGGIGQIRQGNYMKGLERALPLAAANVLKSYREYNEGITARNNTPIFFGREPVRANTYDAVLRLVSLNPARIARIREKQYFETLTAQDMQETRSEIYSRFRRYFLASPPQRSKDQYLDLLREVREYNQQVRLLGRRDIPYITKESLQAAVRKVSVPPRKERLRIEGSLRPRPAIERIPETTAAVPPRTIGQWAGF